MANGGDNRLAAAEASIEQESPVVPSPSETPTANIPPPRLTAPNRVDLTEENQSLLNSLRSSAALTPQERDTCTQSLFNLMTSSEDHAGAAQFREVLSRLDEDGSDLRKMAVLLTSDLDRFMEVARKRNGSNRIKTLLGKSDDVDIFFHNAILRRFFHVMSHRNASRVAIQGMRVFSQAKKTALYDNVLHHAVNLACDGGGYAVLKQIINEWSGGGNFYYRDQLLYVIAQNALRLSYDDYGNYVVQHVLTLHDLRCTQHVSVSLSGHCCGLSFTKLGHYVVEKLLDTEEEGEVVVGELLCCYGETLVQLARSEFGSFVVWKAVRVMRERNRDLFWCLVNKLMPFVDLLRGRKIGAFLDSLC